MTFTNFSCYTQTIRQVPSNYTYLATPIQRVERGPQPERSPVLGRFEAPGGQPGLITVLTRRAQAYKQTLLQVRGWVGSWGDILLACAASYWLLQPSDCVMWAS
jgi:hypothetical protein